MKIVTTTIFAMILLLAGAESLTAQARLSISAVGRTSKVKLVYRTRSAVVDLEDALAGTNGSLPGDPPHVYRVLFTAEKDGFLYLVANVRSHSPISDKNAPCGGDSPQAVLWIKADKTLKDHKFQSEIYESCSYNYSASKLRVTKTGLVATYGGREMKTMKYDNRDPEKGLVVTSMLERPDDK